MVLKTILNLTEILPREKFSDTWNSESKGA